MHERVRARKGGERRGRAGKGEEGRGRARKNGEGRGRARKGHLNTPQVKQHGSTDVRLRLSRCDVVSVRVFVRRSVRGLCLQGQLIATPRHIDICMFDMVS